MANRYKEFKHLNLPAIEKEILDRWEREKAFEKSVELALIHCILISQRCDEAQHQLYRMWQGKPG